MRQSSLSFVAPVAFSKHNTVAFPKRSTRPNADICVTRASLPESSELRAFISLVRDSQQRLCQTLESVDGLSNFSSDKWESGQGSGLTRVLQNGHVFEKAGVNVSVVQGTLSPARAEAFRKRGKPAFDGEPFKAAALSFVLHGQSPHVPTLRGDVRVLVTNQGLSFGGGADLTVFYVNHHQVAGFHRHWKAVCDAYDSGMYKKVSILFSLLGKFTVSNPGYLNKKKLKKQCDDYFYIPSRAEYRGVGGIFYDDLELASSDQMPFTGSMLDNFLPSYLPIVKTNANLPYSALQKKWQRIRRGRYLEFNLLNDRGVRFGLSGAHHSRMDAIMVSAPPSVEWPYRCEVESQSSEWKTLQLLRGKPIDWITMEDGECRI